MRALRLIGVRPAGIIVAGTLVLAFTAPAAAAPGWVPGGRLAITSPQIAMATDGTIVFAGSAPVQPFGTGLSVQVRPPGGPIGPATEIQAHNAPLRGFALAAGTDGRVLIAWGESATVRAAYLAPGRRRSPRRSTCLRWERRRPRSAPSQSMVRVAGRSRGGGIHDVSTSAVVTLHLTRIPAQGPAADRVIRTFTKNLNDDHSSYGVGPTRLALSDDGRPVLGWLEAHDNSGAGGSYSDSAWTFVPYDVFASAMQLDSTTGTDANGFPAIPDIRVARAGGGRFAIAWSTHTGTDAAPSRTVSLIGNGKIGFGEIAQVIPAGGAELGAIGFLDDSRLLVGVRATTAGRTLPRATICTWVGATPGCGAAQTLGDADDLSTAFRGPSITTSGGHALAAWIAPDGRGHGAYAPADGQFQAPGTFPGAASDSPQQELPLALAPSGEGVSSLFRPENATVVGDAIGFDATPTTVAFSGPNEDGNSPHPKRLRPGGPGWGLSEAAPGEPPRRLDLPWAGASVAMSGAIHAASAVSAGRRDRRPPERRAEIVPLAERLRRAPAGSGSPTQGADGRAWQRPPGRRGAHADEQARVVEEPDGAEPGPAGRDRLASARSRSSPLPISETSGSAPPRSQCACSTRSRTARLPLSRRGCPGSQGSLRRPSRGVSSCIALANGIVDERPGAVTVRAAGAAVVVRLEPAETGRPSSLSARVSAHAIARMVVVQVLGERSDTRSAGGPWAGILVRWSVTTCRRSTRRGPPPRDRPATPTIEATAPTSAAVSPTAGRSNVG